MSPTGASRISRKYRRATERSPIRQRRSTIMARPPAAQAADAEQDEQRDEQQHGRHGRGADRVVALDLLEREDRRDLRLERHVAGDEHDGAELADRPRERERRAAE